MDNHAQLKRLESVTAAASSRVIEAQLQVYWYQSALEQKSAWARRVEAERDLWRLRYWVCFVLVLVLAAGCTALAFR